MSYIQTLFKKKKVCKYLFELVIHINSAALSGFTKLNNNILYSQYINIHINQIKVVSMQTIQATGSVEINPAAVSFTAIFRTT